LFSPIRIVNWLGVGYAFQYAAQEHVREGRDCGREWQISRTRQDGYSTHIATSHMPQSEEHYMTPPANDTPVFRCYDKTGLYFNVSG
jgi:hypothetical protein